MDNVAHTFEHAGMTVELIYDTQAENPLQYANVGKFIAWGDHNYDGCIPDGFKAVADPELEYDASEDWDSEDWQTRSVRQALQAENPKAALIVLMEWTSSNHGPASASLDILPITSSGDSANAAWLVTQAELENEWSGNVADAERYIKGVVGEFVSWYNGEVYGAVVKSPAGNELDSLWGLIGNEYAIAEGRDMASYAAQLVAQEEAEREYWGARDVETVGTL